MPTNTLKIRRIYKKKTYGGKRVHITFYDNELFEENNFFLLAKAANKIKPPCSPTELFNDILYTYFAENNIK